MKIRINELTKIGWVIAESVLVEMLFGIVDKLFGEFNGVIGRTSIGTFPNETP